jgi:hypothetical protein
MPDQKSSTKEKSSLSVSLRRPRNPTGHGSGLCSRTQLGKTVPSSRYTTSQTSNNRERTPIVVKITPTTRPWWQRDQGQSQRTRSSATEKILLSFPWRRLSTPNQRLPHAKATKDRMARVALADNQRVNAQTYQPQQYNQHQYLNKHPYYPQQENPNLFP